MKKLLFLTAIAVLTFNSSNAQEEVVVLVDETVVVVNTPTGFAKSDLYVSGAVGFNTMKVGDADGTYGWEVSPSVGYFLTDNIALEAGLTFEGSDADYSFNWGANLGARYFVSAAKPFSFTVGAGFGYKNTQFSDGVIAPGDYSTNFMEFAVKPGLNYFVSDSFALTATMFSLGINSTKTDLPNADATTRISLGLDWRNIMIGLTYKL